MAFFELRGYATPAWLRYPKLPPWCDVSDLPGPSTGSAAETWSRSSPVLEPDGSYVCRMRATANA
jgi:hypothetical protein